MTVFHPTIVSSKLIATVNFYEDYFDFVPVVEEDGYTLLCTPDLHGGRIAIFDTRHRRVKDVQPVRGLILNIPVEDVRGKYDLLYMEGLEFLKEPGTDIHGRKHFWVRDPNGVIVNVHEAVEVSALEPT
ncbi:MAG TPA: VOC family protein [Micavibrio sp.]|nr:VOC family protein [Micavibrio sp.]